MLTYTLDSTHKMPLYEQLYRAIRGDIIAGTLAGDARLPAKRQLAEHLQISRITVDTCYAQLVAEGYVRAVPRIGYFIEPLDAIGTQHRTVSPAPILSTPAPPPQALQFDFKTNAVDTASFPFSTWAKQLRGVLTDYEQTLLLASSPQGVPLLREQICNYLYAFRGIAVSPEQVIVGAGSEYLVGLMISLLGRNRIYALENPCYPKLAHIFASNDAATIPLDMHDDGPCLNQLQDSQASVAYLTPSHHFPLGVVTSATRRAALLHWVEGASDRYIIEDDYDAEFRYTSRPIPAMKELDHSDRVIYLNTFAKSLAPSLRIGYAVLPLSLLEAYRQKFGTFASTVPSFEQYTLARFFQTGGFERHVNRMRAQYRLRRDTLLHALSTSRLQGHYTVQGAEAGLHILLTIHGNMDEAALIATAAQADVRVYGLSQYYGTHTAQCPPNTVVLGYGGMRTAQINAAVARLQQAWMP